MNLNMIKTFLSISICVWITVQFSSAATVPAGTTLVVRTLNAIHSDDRTGTSFKAKLDQNIMVQGRLVLAAGTILSGRVETSQAFRLVRLLCQRERRWNSVWRNRSTCNTQRRVFKIIGPA